MRAVAVRETKLAEDTLEIVAVVVTDIPKDGLEVSGTRRLVDGIDYLLEAVGDDLVDSASFLRQVHHFVGTEVVVFTIFLLDKVVHVHEELGCGAGAGEHRGDHEDHVDKAAAERLKVGGCGGVAANGFRAFEQPRVHGNAGAVVGKRGLVVLVDKVLLEQGNVFVRQLLAVHLLDAVAQHASIKTNVITLGQFADERSDVLLLYIGVGVVFASRSGIGCRAIGDEEVEFLERLTVFCMAIAINHVVLCHGVVALSHQGNLHLVLNFLYADTVVNTKPCE